MSLDVKTAIRATVQAMKAELAAGKGDSKLRDLSLKAIEAAEKVAGTTPGARGERE